MGFKASETLLGIETATENDTTASQLELQSLWNPFRDWNAQLFQTPAKFEGALQSLWNPFRDWNNAISSIVPLPSLSGFKASETLLGIETIQGLDFDTQLLSFKASETLLGIETGLGRISYWLTSFKASETLLGIETNPNYQKPTKEEKASKPLKPF